MHPPLSHSASALCRRPKDRLLPWLSCIFAFLKLKPTKTSVFCSCWRLHVLEQSSFLEGCCEEDRQAWGLWVPVASAIEFWVFCCVWGDLGRAQIVLIEVVCHAGVKISDLLAVWLIAVKIVFLGVVVAKVVIAYLSIKCEQIFTPFHYKNLTFQNEKYLSIINFKS